MSSNTLAGGLVPLGKSGMVYGSDDENSSVKDDPYSDWDDEEEDDVLEIKTGDDITMTSAFGPKKTSHTASNLATLDDIFGDMPKSTSMKTSQPVKKSQHYSPVENKKQYSPPLGSRTNTDQSLESPISPETNMYQSHVSPISSKNADQSLEPLISPKTNMYQSHVSPISPSSPPAAPRKVKFTDIEHLDKKLDVDEKSVDDENDSWGHDDLLNDLMPDDVSKTNKPVEKPSISKFVPEKIIPPEIQDDGIVSSYLPSREAQSGRNSIGQAGYTVAPRRRTRRNVNSGIKSLIVSKPSSKIVFSDSSDDDTPVPSKVPTISKPVPFTDPIQIDDSLKRTIKVRPRNTDDQTETETKDTLPGKLVVSSPIMETKNATVFKKSQSPGMKPATSLQIDSLLNDATMKSISKLVNDLEQLKDTESRRWETEREKLKFENSQKIKQLEADVQAIKIQNEELQSREQIALTSKLETEEGSKRVVNSLQQELERLKERHSRELQVANRQQETAHVIAETSTCLSESSLRLSSIELKLQTRFETSEAARIAHLESRERMVTDMENAARLQLEQASQEVLKLRDMQTLFEVSNKQMSFAIAEDRMRLKEEHSRMEALQLTLKTEAEFIRSDAMDERAKLREAKMVWEAEKHEFQKEMFRKQARLDSDSEMLAQDRRNFESDCSSRTRQHETMSSRFREEELKLRQSREAHMQTRRLLEEQSYNMEKSQVELNDQRLQLKTEGDRVQDARSKLEAEMNHYKDTKQLHVQALNMHNENDALRAKVQNDMHKLEHKRSSLNREQQHFSSIRLQIATERSNMYKSKSKALQIANEARVAQATLAVQSALSDDPFMNDPILNFR